MTDIIVTYQQSPSSEVRLDRVNKVFDFLFDKCFPVNQPLTAEMGSDFEQEQSVSSTVRQALEFAPLTIPS